MRFQCSRWLASECFASGFRSRGGFLSEWESIGDALDIEDHGDAGEDPSEWWVLGLQLGDEDEGLASGLIHVDGALIDSFLFFALDDHNRFAVDDRYDGELLLGLGLFETARRIPAGTLDLETEDVGTVTVLLLG